MKKRDFLLPLVSLASAFTSGQALANVVYSAPDSFQTNGESVKNLQASNVVFVNKGDDKFSFVLKRADSGELIAWHQSHRSHSSHSSHRSHYSGY